jgi:RHS repeat-associated protein
MDGRMLKALWGLCLATALLPAQAQEVYYIHTDALGSPVAETDASRNVVARFEYEPYGRRLNGSNDDKPGYTGHVMDAVTGLVQMQQRYYDPQIGRTLSVDPVTAYDNGDMRHFNRYAYAFNNPYKFTDPDGRESSAIRAMERDHRAFLSGEMAGSDVVANREARGLGAAAGAAGAVVGVVAVKSGAVAATVSATVKVADSVGKAAAAADRAYAAGGLAVYAKGKEVVQAVAAQANQAYASIVTNPITTTAVTHADSVVDAALANVPRTEPPRTGAGVMSAVAGAMVKSAVTPPPPPPPPDKLQHK